MTETVNRGGRPKKRFFGDSSKNAVTPKRTRGAPKGARYVLTVGRYTDLATKWCQWVLSPPGTKLPALYAQLAKQWDMSPYAVKKLVAIALSQGGRTLNVAWFDTIAIDGMVTRRYRDFNVAADELARILNHEQLKVAHSVLHQDAPGLIDLAFMHATFPEDRALLTPQIMSLLSCIPIGNEVFRTVELGDAPPPDDATPFTVTTTHEDGTIEHVRRAFIYGTRKVDWRTSATRQQLADRYARGKFLEAENAFKKQIGERTLEAFLVEPIIGKLFLQRVRRLTSVAI